MSLRKNLGAALVLSFVVGACGNAVSPQGDGGRDANSSDATAGCTLQNGGFCPVGSVCPAGDGCNSCMCMANGVLGCTTIGCIDASMPRPCRSGAECANGQECVFTNSSCGATGECMAITPCFQPETFCSCAGVTYQACRANQPTRNAGVCEGPPPVGCNPMRTCSPDQECVYPVGACGVDGRCSPITDCAATASFCGCDGTTFRGCPNRPTQPAAGVGSCSGSSDAGVSCAGARLNANGACVDSAGATAPVTCCSGYNCNQMTAACESLPPTCPAGFVPSVVGACWGPCVPRELCR